MMKKISALLLALVMVLAIGATAFASATGDTATDGIAGNDASTGIWTGKDTPVAQGNTAIIYKEITAYNPETGEINAPTITYTYTITAGNANKDIYDDKQNHNPEATDT